MRTLWSSRRWPWYEAGWGHEATPAGDQRLPTEGRRHPVLPLGALEAASVGGRRRPHHPVRRGGRIRRRPGLRREPVPGARAPSHPEPPAPGRTSGRRDGCGAGGVGSGPSGGPRRSPAGSPLRGGPARRRGDGPRPVAGGPLPARQGPAVGIAGDLCGWLPGPGGDTGSRYRAAHRGGAARRGHGPVPTPRRRRAGLGADRPGSARGCPDGCRRESPRAAKGHGHPRSGSRTAPVIAAGPGGGDSRLGARSPPTRGPGGIHRCARAPAGSPAGRAPTRPLRGR